MPDMAAPPPLQSCRAKKKFHLRDTFCKRLTCAVTGSIHTPSMSQYLPVTPDEIAQAAIGAAIVHLHVPKREQPRDPKDGGSGRIVRHNSMTPAHTATAVDG